MAWLVIYERVPDIHNRTRLTGELQSMYGTSAHRGRGIGTALLESLTAAADARGVSRVTVAANDKALPLYVEAGFQPSPLFLERCPSRA